MSDSEDIDDIDVDAVNTVVQELDEKRKARAEEQAKQVENALSHR